MSIAVHGVIQSRNFEVEQRCTPRVMNPLSIWLTTGILLSGARRIGGFADPLLFGAVINLGIGVDGFQQAEAVGILRSARDVGGGLVEVAEADGLSGAGLRAGGDVCRQTVGLGYLFGGVPAAVTEVALLDHSAHTRRDVGIQGFLHAGGPCRIPPVEIARMIGAGHHAVAAAEAALRHLFDDSSDGVDVDRLLPADADARSVPAMLAEHRDESRTPVRALAAVIDLKNADPGDTGTIGGAAFGGGNVVLHRASNHAGTASVAAVDIDRHAVAAGGLLAGFGTHALTTFARAAGPHTS